MSTIVYQGLQSCFEPQPTETKPLRLILAAPKDTKQVLGDNNDINTTTQNTEKSYSGGWSFLQSLSNSNHTSPNKPLDCDGFYPSPKLSQRSLEICTENLGSETGSDDSIDMNIFNFEPRSAKTTTRKQGHVLSSKKANPRSFPPPLTTMSGPNSIQVRPHREGGRLIIKAVEAPSTSTCFEAERSHGRLQLRFVENCKFFYDYNMNSSEDYEEDDSIGESETTNDDAISGANNNIVDEIEKNICYMKNDMDGNKKDAEVEMEREREKIQRHNSRCKESGHGNIKKGLCNWEAFWVAT